MSKMKADSQILQLYDFSSTVIYLNKVNIMLIIVDEGIGVAMVISEVLVTIALEFEEPLAPLGARYLLDLDVKNAKIR